MDISVTYRITQTESDQTSGIVYETAIRAAESENSVYQVGLYHDEDEHFNLGRTQEWLPGISEELQFRRFGGGDYVLHDDTYCFIDARLKLRSKELVDQQRSRMAYRTLKAFETVFDTVGIKEGSRHLKTLDGEPLKNSQSTAYFDPERGDIYFQEGLMPSETDPQIAGIGIADLNQEFGSVVVGRVCMYPGKPSEKAVDLDRQVRKSLKQEEVKLPEKSLDNRIKPVEDLETVASVLEGETERHLNAGDFIQEESRRKGSELQNEDGCKTPGPCF